MRPLDADTFVFLLHRVQHYAIECVPLPIHTKDMIWHVQQHLPPAHDKYGSVLQ